MIEYFGRWVEKKRTKVKVQGAYSLFVVVVVVVHLHQVHQVNRYQLITVIITFRGIAIFCVEQQIVSNYQ